MCFYFNELDNLKAVTVKLNVSCSAILWRTKVCLRFISFLIIITSNVSSQYKFLFQNNEYLQSVCRCLQILLRLDPYRNAFVDIDGVNT